MYGQEGGAGERFGDLAKILAPDFTDTTNLRIVKQSFEVTGGVTTELTVAIPESCTCYGGFIEVKNSGGAGNLDMDLGLSTGAGDFGTGYGDHGDGIYGFRATEFINVGSEKFFLSFDGNTQSSSEVSTVTVCALVGLCKVS